MKFSVSMCDSDGGDNCFNFTAHTIEKAKKQAVFLTEDWMESWENQSGEKSARWTLYDANDEELDSGKVYYDYD